MTDLSSDSVDTSLGLAAAAEPACMAPAAAPPADDGDDLSSHLANSKAAPQATIGVLHVINGEDYSGAERVQDLLALRLPECGYEVAFACVKPDRFAAACEAQRARLFETPMRSRIDLRPAWRLARLVRQHDYRLVHAHSPRAALVGSIAARLAGVPFVHHVHGQTAVDTVPWWQRGASALAERISLSRASAVIAVSESAAEYMRQQGIPPALIRVIPNGVPSPETLRQRPEPQPPWIVGTVAMFRPRKGVEVLLDAVGLLHERGVPVRLRMVGRFQFTDYEQQIRQYVRDRGLEPLVDWVGFTTDVPGELAKMDLFVLPSVLAEGLPMAVIEAMAAGVPAIGTRVAGTSDTIRHGVDGVLVEPADAGAMADAVADFVRGRWNWQTIRQAAYEQQRRRFSDRSMAASVAQVYADILAAADRGPSPGQTTAARETPSI